MSSSQRTDAAAGRRRDEEIKPKELRAEGEEICARGKRRAGDNNDGCYYRSNFRKTRLRRVRPLSRSLSVDGADARDTRSSSASLKSSARVGGRRDRRASGARGFCAWDASPFLRKRCVPSDAINEDNIQFPRLTERPIIAVNRESRPLVFLILYTSVNLGTVGVERCFRYSGVAEMLETNRASCGTHAISRSARREERRTRID